jgi:predicted DNA-binding transcriptional regulator AlpA
MSNQTVVNKANQTTSTQASFSEIELCAHWSICPKTAHNRRNAGKFPPHFKQGQQVRYLLSDIEAFEQSRKSKTKTH